MGWGGAELGVGRPRWQRSGQRSDRFSLWSMIKAAGLPATNPNLFNLASNPWRTAGIGNHVYVTRM